jgi:membrane fusion protein, multidrug efflux system
MKIMLICAGLLFGSIFLYKIFGIFMFKHMMATMQAPTVTVSAMKAGYSVWQPELQYYSSLRAIRGVNVTTELAGLVQTIYFTPGAEVKEGDVLVQLNANSDNAQLRSLQANADLANTTYLRDKAQYAIKAISKAVLDTDADNLKSLQAQVAQQAAIVAKKTIRAPFSGKLGISAINPGQYLNAGDTIVPLQELDLIYVDFYAPQQNLTKLSIGQPITLIVDTFPGQQFTGKITTINPVLDTSTRNVEVEATISNTEYKLVPGMFGTVVVNTGAPKRYITLPQSAISYNPYGNIVFIVSQNGFDKKHIPVLTVNQSFVTTGEARGDQVTILQGLKEGDTVVTSGQVKLKNGTRIAIDNSTIPSNNPAPMPVDE